MGKPDLIFEMVEPFKVPADGTVPYTYVTIPTNLKEDIWISGVELQADRSPRAAPHHQRPGRRRRTADAEAEPDDGPLAQGDRRRLGGYVPGRLDTEFDEGVARKIPAAPTSCCRCTTRRLARRSATDCRSASMLAKEPPTRLRAAGGGQMPNTTFAIPPGDPNYEVIGKQTFDKDTYLNTHVSAHARPRQGRHLQGRVSGRRGRSPVARAEVRLQLAVDVTSSPSPSSCRRARR